MNGSTHNTNYIGTYCNVWNITQIISDYIETVIFITISILIIIFCVKVNEYTFMEIILLLLGIKDYSHANYNRNVNAMCTYLYTAICQVII